MWIHVTHFLRSSSSPQSTAYSTISLWGRVEMTKHRAIFIFNYSFIQVLWNNFGLFCSFMTIMPIQLKCFQSQLTKKFQTSLLTWHTLESQHTDIYKPSSDLMTLTPTSPLSAREAMTKNQDVFSCKGTNNSFSPLVAKEQEKPKYHNWITTTYQFTQIHSHVDVDTLLVSTAHNNLPQTHSHVLQTHP